MSSSSLDPVSLTVGLGIGMVLMAAIRRLGGAEKPGICNPGIMKDQPKVATMCKVQDVEDLLKDKAAVAYCRCGRSLCARASRPRTRREALCLGLICRHVAALPTPARPCCGRCWRSKTFPLCDGSHVKFNTESGDNTGPLVFKKS